ncbi:DoxX family protein [Nocardia stercoris]|uniref:DoxX family protein n=1 Tax=Nocardia stercoris TaxID=2483361 RepID=A0A3M2L6Z8_9NOCA|nr:DoxX family protein [Nocardia stercoris]RMI30308.1 DoxX family protein [Nocardia stercoris]
MNLALWIAAGLLAFVALAGGFTKTFLPVPKLAAAHGAEWIADVSTRFVRTLGVTELLAAAGLVLPALLDIAPIMVAVTACCWMLLMIGAMRTHARLGQRGLVLVNAVYLAIALFVAVGRLALHPF